MVFQCMKISLYNTAPRPLQCFISKLRNRDIIKLFGLQLTENVRGTFVILLLFLLHDYRP